MVPSERLRQQVRDLLQHGPDTPAELSSIVIHQGMDHLLQEMLEQEVTDRLGRERQQRQVPAHFATAIAIGMNLDGYAPSS